MTAALPMLALTPRTVQIRLSARWELARRDPRDFFRWFVFTNRTVGRENIITAFPWHKPHLQQLTSIWQDNQLVFVSKCRQVLATWWAAGLCLWDALCHSGRLIMLQGKRLEDVVGDMETGDGLLGRAKFILRHIPGRRLLGLDWLPFENGSERVTFPRNHSVLWGIPQGAEVIRQRTAGGICTDECAVQEQFEESVTAALPCIRAGGWLLCITTANTRDKGFSRRIVRDLGDDE